MQRIDEEMAERIARAGELVETKRAELEAAIAEKRSQLAAEFESELHRHEERSTTRSEELLTAGQQIEADLKAGGKSVAEDLVFTPTGEVVAKAGEPAKGALVSLRKAVKAEVAALDAEVKEARASRRETRAPRGSDRRPDLAASTTRSPPSDAGRAARPMTRALARDGASQARSRTSRCMQTLTESEYRSLTDEAYWRALFDAGMGAEAIKKIIEQLDLDELAPEAARRDAPDLRPAAQEGDQAPAPDRGVPQERQRGPSG